jgi:antitoxin (DNA-binding transcriptional repressor) of toxin-antitoxin stability system
MKPRVKAKSRATLKNHRIAKAPATTKAASAAKIRDTAKTYITATEAARKFSEILNRVKFKGESFIVERNGKPICEISPSQSEGISTQELVELLRSAPWPDKGYFDILEEITRNQPTVAPSPWER